MIICIAFSICALYPVWRGDCKAILNSSFYDLSRFEERNADMMFPPGSEGLMYVVRLCPSNEPSNRDPYADSFLLRCDGGGACQSCVTQNSLDYKPLNPSNFSEGVVYFADGEPFADKAGVVRTVDLEWRIICDPSSDSPDAPANFTFIDGANTTGMVMGTIRSRYGCPTTTRSPSPTPAYAPDCKFVDRYDGDRSIGVRMDLADLNDGPFGVKSVVEIATNNTLYFQACERMGCPPLFKCTGSPALSSAWLCDENSMECTSYGVGIEQPDFRPIELDVSKGMVLAMEDQTSGNSVELSLECVKDFPEGHINWDRKATMSGKELKVKGKTQAVCLVPVPSPAPSTDVCRFSASIDNHKVSIDLKALNNGQAVGWSKAVKAAGHDDAVLMYQPCGGMACPDKTYCSGDEDAAIWLCFVQDGENICQGYGMWENNVSLGLWNEKSTDSGVRATYRGDMRRTVQVQYLCDETRAEGELQMPSEVSLSQREMSFSVHVSGVCPSAMMKRSRATYGAAFLFLFASFVVVYFAIGGLTTSILHGKVMLPNNAFWESFFRCIDLAARTILGCRRPLNNYEYM